ncbi:hypothetical protein [Almyronema epifaneia]|uniref:Uncharacterized protein n=1 Tax=Almyronema epifaneia S1 TaxID=2991925 RepID=A0ABW6IFD7_9CYAN
MIQAWSQRWSQTITRLLNQPRYQLILRLTLVIVALQGIDELHAERLPEKGLAVVMLFSAKLLQSRYAWCGLAALMVWNNVYFWWRLVNHEYLITYWVLVCAIAAFSQFSLKIFAWNARLLIGLCFLFATAWKFMGGEYLDGSFLHLTFLVDPRLAMGATWLGGVAADLLQDNYDQLLTIQAATSPESALINSSPLMSALSVALSYWTIFIEGIVAIAFLSPWPRWLFLHRDEWLLIFVVSTYSVIPVFSFAAILLLMGLAQCALTQRFKAALYLNLLLLIPLWLPLPQEIFYFLQQWS